MTATWSVRSTGKIGGLMTTGGRPDNPRGNNMLTAKRVERTTKPGRYRCGMVKGLLAGLCGTTSALPVILSSRARGDEACTASA